MKFLFSLLGKMKGLRVRVWKCTKHSLLVTAGSVLAEELVVTLRIIFVTSEHVILPPIGCPQVARFAANLDCHTRLLMEPCNVLCDPRNKRLPVIT